MREYKKILLAVDITEGSEKIAERARDVAERYGAEVILLHVV
ncbi:MAG: universal stress protein, partial [Steroidobacteraceae bacterium]|nr:universal stress protein [Steroidobacteraceae bacterium]